MKFQNIQQYAELVSTCQFCGSSMEIKIYPNKPVHFGVRYKMDFNNTQWFPSEPYIKADPALTSELAISFLSKDNGDHLSFNYKMSEVEKPILLIDKITNKVEGDLDRVQKVIWDHQLSLLKCCSSDNCKMSGNRYISYTSPLVLERNSKCIYSFSMKIEMIAASLRDNIFNLITPYDRKVGKTLLVAEENNKLISQLPLMALYKIKGKEIIVNKIKTLINFS